MRVRWIGKFLALSSLFVLGFALGMFLWYFYSQTLITDVPRARSFAFYLPISFIGAFIILWFCPKQPKIKYQGLTLATLGEPILAQQKKIVDEQGKH